VDQEITDMPEYQPRALARKRLLSQMNVVNPEDEKK